MKKAAAQKKKTDNRAVRGHLLSLWKGLSIIGSSFIKFSCLILVVVSLSLFFVTIYQYLLTSAYIKLEEVVITGVDGEMKHRLLEMSQLRFDLSLLAVNTRDLKRRLEKHPWIRSVDIEKHFPHTLMIHAEKQEPCGVVALDKLYYVNRHGEMFKEVDQDDALDFPIVTGLPPQGEDLQTKLRLATQVLDFLENHGGDWSERDLSEIHLEDHEYFTLYLRSIPGAVCLSRTSLETKLGKLNRVIDHLNKTGRTHMVRSINLDYGDGVVVSFRNT
jgi:cell division protein FtsQ